MTTEILYTKLQNSFANILEKYGLEDSEVTVDCRSLSPEEAIGKTRRRDYPILTGKDVMIQAEYKGSRGQAFTDSPSAFSGKLSEIKSLNPVKDPRDRGIFIAILNAVMSYLGLCSGTVHCRTDGPELCAEEMLNYLHRNYPDKKKIALIGYQPALLEMLAESSYRVRVLDLNSDNIGKQRFGVYVEDGNSAKNEIIRNYADLILCTGSTLCNGTIVDYMDLDTEVLFYGITLAGSADFLGLKRVCFAESFA